MQRVASGIVDKVSGSSNNKKTVIRSFRLNADLSKKLSLAATRAGMTENAFVANMLAKKVDLSPLISPFGGIGLSRELFREILGQVNQTTIEIVASEIAFSEVPLAFGLLKLDMSVSSLVWFMKHILDDDCGWFHLEAASSEELLLTHDYGLKWSLFLKAYLASVFQSLIRHNAEIKESGRLVTIDLSENGSDQFSNA